MHVLYLIDGRRMFKGKKIFSFIIYFSFLHFIDKTNKQKVPKSLIVVVLKSKIFHFIHKIYMDLYKTFVWFTLCWHRHFKAKTHLRINSLDLDAIQDRYLHNIHIISTTKCHTKNIQVNKKHKKKERNEETTTECIQFICV